MPLAVGKGSEVALWKISMPVPVPKIPLAVGKGKDVALWKMPVLMPLPMIPLVVGSKVLLRLPLVVAL